MSIFSLATQISGLSCPRCSSTAFHKNGKHLGLQRFRCRCCRRTFNETINTPLHGIHDKQKMLDYLLTMHHQQSIRAASKQIGISIPTSFSWRHRILSSLKEQAPSAVSLPSGISEIKIPHSFKGKRGVHKPKLPDTHSLLLSNAQGIPCLHLLTKAVKTFEASLLITNSLRPDTHIAVAKTNLLSRISRKIQLPNAQNRYESNSLKKQSSDTVERLSVWMSRFNGVATKYLQQYWNWFRAECNSFNFGQFRNECFGHRQLMHYRHIVARWLACGSVSEQYLLRNFRCLWCK